MDRPKILLEQKRNQQPLSRLTPPAPLTQGSREAFKAAVSAVGADAHIRPSFFSPSVFAYAQPPPSQREANFLPKPRPTSGSLCEGAGNRRLTEGEKMPPPCKGKCLAGQRDRLKILLEQKRNQQPLSRLTPPAPLTQGSREAFKAAVSAVGADAHIRPSFFSPSVFAYAQPPPSQREANFLPKPRPTSGSLC